MFLRTIHIMKQYLSIIPLIILSACVSTEGLTKESTKPPKGNVNSSILVEEFSDLQCPACRGAHLQIVGSLMEKYGRNIRFEFKHFPLSQIHPYAQEAAEATECAADQGKFWEYVDDTFQNQTKLTRDDLLERAETVGIADTELFERCLSSHIKRDAVQADYKDGSKRGVRGTPTFFISGKQVPRHTLEGLSAMIEEQMGRQRL